MTDDGTTGGKKGPKLRPVRRVTGKKIRNDAGAEFGEMMIRKNVPSALSSYMSTEKLPEKYRIIEHYVLGVRENLLHELGEEPTQLQMLSLDGICETLVLCKFMSCFLSEDPEKNLINMKRECLKSWVNQGYITLQNQLDKKLDRWFQLAKVRKAKTSPTQAHLQAILGPKKPKRDRSNRSDDVKKGRPKLDTASLVNDILDSEVTGEEPVNPSDYKGTSDD